MERSEGTARAAGAAAAAGTAEASASDAAPHSGRPGNPGDAASVAVSRPPAAEGRLSQEAAGIHVSCLMNARYHAGREAFLDRVHRFIMFAVIVMGAGALIDLGVRHFPWIKEAFGALAVLLAAVDLACDLSNRARTHAMMKRRYFELLADFGEGKRSALETRACLNRYSADEEPAYHALIEAAWNAAQVMVYGKTANQVHIPLWHRWLQNVFHFGDSSYKVVQPAKAPSEAGS